MSQPKSLRVMVEPMPLMEEKNMETKESKKKPKEEKNAPSVGKDVPSAESTSNGHSTAPKEAESLKQENGVSKAVNGKSKKEKSSKRGTSPSIKSSDKPVVAVTNGISDVALNSTAVVASAAASQTPELTPEAIPEIMEDDASLVQNPEPDNDELFPELNYDETSDNELASASPSFSPVGRSATRRSQAKKIPTPETPQLPNVKSDTPEVEMSRSPSRHTPDQTTPLRERVFKMKEAYTPIRVSSSPAADSGSRERDENDDESKNGNGTSEIGSAKDIHFSKSRMKLSPFRRSSRISEQYSIMANYSGNNSTQQTELIGDISSSSRDPSDNGEQSVDLSQAEKNLSSSFKHISGRRSYRQLREISLHNLSAQRLHRQREQGERRESEIKDSSISSVNATAGSGSACDTVSSDSSTKWTPVGHVVGRKRRQDSCEEALESLPPSPSLPPIGVGVGEEAVERPSKRARLLGYVSTPLRQLREKVASSTPILKISIRVPEQTATNGEETELQEELPKIAEVAPLGERGPEHKWCSIM